MPHMCYLYRCHACPAYLLRQPRLNKRDPTQRWLLSARQRLLSLRRAARGKDSSFFTRVAQAPQCGGKGHVAPALPGFFLPRYNHLRQGAVLMILHKGPHNRSIRQRWWAASPVSGIGLHAAALFAQSLPVVYGAAADTEGLVCLHLAHAAVQGRQHAQPQVLAVRCSHDLSVASLSLNAIYS